MAADHAGFEMKEYLKEKLVAEGYQIEDFGTCSTESSDYPDYAHPLGSAIDRGDIQRAIVVCGSGNGINMTINKHKAVRSALCWNPEIVQLARLHNDANVCSLPGRFLNNDTAWNMTQLFLTTGFEGGRHQRRIDKISNY